MAFETGNPQKPQKETLQEFIIGIQQKSGGRIAPGGRESVHRSEYVVRVPDETDPESTQESIITPSVVRRIGRGTGGASTYSTEVRNRYPQHIGPNLSVFVVERLSVSFEEGVAPDVLQYVTPMIRRHGATTLEPAYDTVIEPQEATDDGFRKHTALLNQAKRRNKIVRRPHSAAVQGLTREEVLRNLPNVVRMSLKKKASGKK